MLLLKKTFDINFCTFINYIYNQLVGFWSCCEKCKLTFLISFYGFSCIFLIPIDFYYFCSNATGVSATTREKGFSCSPNACALVV